MPTHTFNIRLYPNPVNLKNSVPHTKTDFSMIVSLISLPPKRESTLNSHDKAEGTGFPSSPSPPSSLRHYPKRLGRKVNWLLFTHLSTAVTRPDPLPARGRPPTPPGGAQAATCRPHPPPRPAPPPGALQPLPAGHPGRPGPFFLKLQQPPHWPGPLPPLRARSPWLGGPRRRSRDACLAGREGAPAAGAPKALGGPGRAAARGRAAGAGLLTGSGRSAAAGVTGPEGQDAAPRAALPGPGRRGGRALTPAAAAVATAAASPPQPPS